ncbi:hypothetical protein KAU32_01445 [bacterium]|nr:hypothetical protein [bacterium]
MNLKIINLVKTVGLLYLALSCFCEIYFFIQFFKITDIPIIDKIFYPKDILIFFCIYFVIAIIGCIGLILLKNWGKIILIITSILGFIVIFYAGIDNALHLGIDIKLIVYLLIFSFLIVFLFNKKVSATIKKHSYVKN